MKLIGYHSILARIVEKMEDAFPELSPKIRKYIAASIVSPKGTVTVTPAIIALSQYERNLEKQMNETPIIEIKPEDIDPALLNQTISLDIGPEHWYNQTAKINFDDSKYNKTIPE